MSDYHHYLINYCSLLWKFIGHTMMTLNCTSLWRFNGKWFYSCSRILWWSQSSPFNSRKPVLSNLICGKILRKLDYLSLCPKLFSLFSQATSILSCRTPGCNTYLQCCNEHGLYLSRPFILGEVSRKYIFPQDSRPFCRIGQVKAFIAISAPLVCKDRRGFSSPMWFPVLTLYMCFYLSHSAFVVKLSDLWWPKSVVFCFILGVPSKSLSSLRSSHKSWSVVIVYLLYMRRGGCHLPALRIFSICCNTHSMQQKYL